MSKSIEDREPPSDADDSTMLNWVLWEMAERLGLVKRTPNDTAYVDVELHKLVKDFFKEHDRNEDMIWDMK